MFESVFGTDDAAAATAAPTRRGELVMTDHNFKPVDHPKLEKEEREYRRNSRHGPRKETPNFEDCPLGRNTKQCPTEIGGAVVSSVTAS